VTSWIATLNRQQMGIAELNNQALRLREGQNLTSWKLSLIVKISWGYFDLMSECKSVVPIKYLF
jgi:hypothetical protein